jgi:glycosyltransferase domain-containing protein
MSAIPRLTIVLPLKGRPLFTLRFLWHANRVRMPFRFLIADGQVRPPLMEMLENSQELFPHLDIEYIRYPDDANWSRYFAKMHDALRRVRTPYVMLADNDDFLAPAGIQSCMEFLDSRPDYVCCAGGIAGFSVYAPLSAPPGKLLGPINRITCSYAPDSSPEGLRSDDMRARVQSGFHCYWFFYSVYRPRALELVWKEIMEMDFSNFHVGELYGTLRTLTLGKACQDQTVTTYFKQSDTAVGWHWATSEAAPSASFVYHLLRSRFSADCSAMIERISRAVAEADGSDAEEIAEQLRLFAEPFVDRIIRNNYGLTARVWQSLRHYAPGVSEWLKTRYRPSVVLEKRGIRDRLRKNGARADYLAEFQSELAHMEDALNGRGFRDFLAHHTHATAS